MKIGIGTYSFGGVASYLGLGPSLLEKFQTIKNLGYSQVELLPGDLFNHSEDIKAWLKETGLEVVSVHAEPSLEMVKAMAAIGGKAVIWAGTPFCDKAEAGEVARLLDQMADMAAPYGIQIGYHNHSQEFYFTEGKSLLEHLLDQGSRFYLQLDCGWAMNAGAYPPSFIRKYRNRILSIHAKENSKVKGPGGLPAARQETRDKPGAALQKVLTLPREERMKMLDDLNNRIQADAYQMENQCKMGAPESNLDWKEIKNALDEQDFDAFWIVEREGFYSDRDVCLAEDCAYLKAIL